mgnify:CR=1 FL=1
MGKLSEAAIVNSINSEYVLLTDSNGLPVRISKNNLAEAVRNVMSEATTEKNGLKPANEVRMEKRLSASNSLIIFEPEISTSLLISVAASGGGVMSHYLMSINRASESMKKPTIILNRIGGSSSSNVPKFKLWADENTGAFKVILERIQYTVGVYAKILNTFQSSSDGISFTAANQDEVDAATYIDVT